MLQIDTIDAVKEKLENFFGQGTGSCGEAGGIEEIPLFQARQRYLAEEIFAKDQNGKKQSVYGKGQRIKVNEIGVLAGLGHAMVQVYSKPVVSIISVGQELVSVFEEPGPDQIRDMNAYTLMALVEETGAKAGGISLVKDLDLELKKTLKEALDRSDIVILSGNLKQHKKAFCDVMNSFGEPGVITKGIDNDLGMDSLISIMKDDHCCCCSRSKLAAFLPNNPNEAITAYLAVMDYFIKKYYFKTEDQDQIESSQLLNEMMHIK